jgi:hypothetical protein
VKQTPWQLFYDTLCPNCVYSFFTIIREEAFLGAGEDARFRKSAARGCHRHDSDNSDIKLWITNFAVQAGDFP